MKPFQGLGRRLAAAAHYIANGTPMPAEPVPTTRAGVLNTGELIILPSTGGTLVFAAHTTDMLRDLLNSDSAFELLPVGGIGAGGTAP